LLRDSTHTALGGLGLPSELDLAAFDQTAVTVFQGTEALASGPLTSLGRVTAPNQMPCAWLAHVAGSEGSSILLNVTVHDADPGDTLNFSWSYYVPDDRDYGSDCTLTNGDTAAASIRCTDDGDYGLGVFVSDGKARYLVGNTLTLSNVAPTVSLATPVDGALFELNALVTADVMFNDPGTNDTHNCVLNWGDGVTTYDGPCLQVNDLPGQSHEYREAGVYTIAATVTDDDGGIGDASKMVVVYDPSAGYVSGEGWISSPAGAYKPTPEMTGKASFGFVSKYRKGASVPDGNTQFVFQAGDLNFHSNAYEWLVVSGSSKAQFKGVGTVNGHTNYGFLLSVTDAADNPKVKDAFRIKIWDRSMGDAVVYDNGIEQPLGGGNIVIRTGYVKK
jgi:hypothetical protein